MSKKAAKPISKTAAKGGIAAKMRAQLLAAAIPAEEWLSAHKEEFSQIEAENEKRWGTADNVEAYSFQKALEFLRELSAPESSTYFLHGDGQYAEDFATLIQSFSNLIKDALYDDELLVDLVEVVSHAVKVIESLPPQRLQAARARVDPWPFALSAHPDFLKEWDKKKGELKAAYKKRWWKGGTIHPSNMPPLSAAMAEIVFAEIDILNGKVNETGCLPIFSLSSLPLWEKEVTRRIESYPLFPEGAYFQRVNRGPETDTPGKRADEIRKAIREVFRTLKRKLETGG